jgi:hypothetical protein
VQLVWARFHKSYLALLLRFLLHHSIAAFIALM